MAGDDLAAILAFYRDNGVDLALEEKGIDRFAESARPRSEATHTRSQRIVEKASAEAPPPKAENRPVLPDETVVSTAREEARQADTLDALRELAAGFEGLNLRHTARQIVFEDGNREAQVMFVGEAPGRDEDIEGRPFVGRSGQLLDRMLAAIGLEREDVYIANVVPWRPPGNRTPTPLEVEICRPFIERQITLVDPDILIALGGAAAKVLLQTEQGITRIRGRWRDFETGRRTIKAMATLHPAYLLRQPAQKRLAWRDMIALKIALGALRPPH